MREHGEHGATSEENTRGMQGNRGEDHEDKKPFEFITCAVQLTNQMAWLKYHYNNTALSIVTAKPLLTIALLSEFFFRIKCLA